MNCHCTSANCIHSLRNGYNECGDFKNWLFDLIDGWFGREAALKIVGGDVFRYNIPMRNYRGVKPTFERFGGLFRLSKRVPRVPLVIEHYS